MIDDEIIYYTQLIVFFICCIVLIFILASIFSPINYKSFDELKAECESEPGMIYGKGTYSGAWDCYPFTIDKLCQSYPEECPVKYWKYNNE